MSTTLVCFLCMSSPPAPLLFRSLNLHVGCLKPARVVGIRELPVPNRTKPAGAQESMHGAPFALESLDRYMQLCMHEFAGCMHVRTRHAQRHVFNSCKGMISGSPLSSKSMFWGLHGRVRKDGPEIHKRSINPIALAATRLTTAGDGIFIYSSSLCHSYLKREPERERPAPDGWGLVAAESTLGEYTCRCRWG